LNEKQSETSLKSSCFVREETGRKVMRENEPVLLVFSVCEGEIILEKGEILSEKRQTERKVIRQSVATARGQSTTETLMESG
jgi:hypothetical protein